MLCSLLLGFGLSAYVVIGQAYDSSDGGDEQREHAWVCTITQSGDVCMIESLTGQRYEIAGGKAGADDVANLPYATVSCVFNNSGFWANKNVDDSIAEVRRARSERRQLGAKRRGFIALAPYITPHTKNIIN